VTHLLYPPRRWVNYTTCTVTKVSFITGGLWGKHSGIALAVSIFEIVPNVLVSNSIFDFFLPTPISNKYGQLNELGQT
jgi:hypothetical protein